MSPIGGLSDELLVAHMGEHLILADLGAPLLLVGIRSPVYAFLLPAPGAQAAGPAQAATRLLSQAAPAARGRARCGS